MPTKIFISYRRADVGGWSRLIRNELKASLGDAEIILDVQAMKPGRNFEQAIHHSLGEVDMVLALIGDEWLAELNSPKRQGKKDYMRIELETALSSGVFLIPLLIDGAVMPEPDALPESLRELALLHAVSITHTDFERDIDYVAKVVREELVERIAGQKPASAPQESATPSPKPATGATERPDPPSPPSPALPIVEYGSPMPALILAPLADPLVVDAIRKAFVTLLAIDTPPATVVSFEDRRLNRLITFTRAQPVVALTVFGEPFSKEERERAAAWIRERWSVQNGAVVNEQMDRFRADFPLSSDVATMIGVTLATFEYICHAPLKRPPKVKFGSVDFAKYPLRMRGS